MLHLTEGRLARVKRSRDLQTPEWTRLINICDQFLPVESPYGTSHITNYALAGLVTGQSSYKSKAISLALARCNQGYDALSHARTGYGNWGGSRDVCPPVAVCYDWLWDDLTTAQRDLMEDWLMRWGSLSWVEAQPADKINTWARQPAHPGDNFYAGFLLASIVPALVVRARSSSRAPQAKALLDLAKQKWTTELLPHKRYYEPMGIPLEGTSYGLQAWSNLALVVDAVKSVEGVDIWPEMATLADGYLKHITTPDLTRLTPWGDDARIPGAKGAVLEPIDDYAMLLALVAANHVPEQGSPTSLAWWMQSVNPPPNPKPFPFHFMAWAPVLFARPELREQSVSNPGSQGGLWVSPMVSRGNGFAIACGNDPLQSYPQPTSDATQLSFIAGPSLESHQPKAAGAVMIYKAGEYLIGRAALWGQVPELGRGAEYHSTLLLPPFHISEPAWKDSGQSQALKDAQASVKITRSVENDRYLYLEAELAGAYAYRNPKWMDDPVLRALRPLKRWTRRILWHRVYDLFLFIDEIEKEPWAEQPVIAWQVRDRPEINGALWTATVPRNSVTGQILSKSVIGMGVRSVEVGNSFRVEVRPYSEPQDPNYYLVVQSMQITSLTPRQAYRQNGALGVTFGSGADAVTLAVQMGDAPPPVTKRLYRWGDGEEFADFNLFTAALKPYLDSRNPSSTTISSRLENSQPQLQGEVIIIPRASA